MRMNRRAFIGALGAGAVALTTVPVAAEADKSIALRVIAYNVYVFKGWPADRAAAKSAVQQGQMAKLIADELALHQPDLINFSESPSEELCVEVAKHLGFHHVRFPSGGRWPGTILSRYPIIESQNVPLAEDRPRLCSRDTGEGRSFSFRTSNR